MFLLTTEEAPMTRPDFCTPPHPEPAIGAVFDSSTRVLGAMIGCFRRQADCPEILTRHGWRTWRWLCMPIGRPLDRDGVQ